MKKRPIAVCSDCIRYSYSLEDIGQPCRKKRGENLCGGVYADVSDEMNWKVCTACDGSAIDFQGKACVACQQSGWILTRRRQ